MSQTEKQFLHQISNDIAPATISLEIILEEVGEPNEKTKIQKECLEAALASIKLLITHINERRELLKSTS